MRITGKGKGRRNRGERGRNQGRRGSESGRKGVGIGAFPPHRGAARPSHGPVAGAGEGLSARLGARGQPERTDWVVRDTVREGMATASDPIRRSDRSPEPVSTPLCASVSLLTGGCVGQRCQGGAVASDSGLNPGLSARLGARGQPERTDWVVRDTVREAMAATSDPIRRSDRSPEPVSTPLRALRPPSGVRLLRPAVSGALSRPILASIRPLGRDHSRPAGAKAGRSRVRTGRGPPPAARCAVARWAARTGGQGVGRRENPPRGTPAAAVLHRAHPCALWKMGGSFSRSGSHPGSPVSSGVAGSHARSPVPITERADGSHPGVPFPPNGALRCGRFGLKHPRGGLRSCIGAVEPPTAGGTVAPRHDRAFSLGRVRVRGFRCATGDSTALSRMSHPAVRRSFLVTVVGMILAGRT